MDNLEKLLIEVRSNYILLKKIYGEVQAITTALTYLKELEKQLVGFKVNLKIIEEKISKLEKSCHFLKKETTNMKESLTDLEVNKENPQF